MATATGGMPPGCGGAWPLGGGGGWPPGDRDGWPPSQGGFWSTGQHNPWPIETDEDTEENKGKQISINKNQPGTLCISLFCVCNCAKRKNRAHCGSGVCLLRYDT